MTVGSGLSVDSVDDAFESLDLSKILLAVAGVLEGTLQVENASSYSSTSIKLASSLDVRIGDAGSTEVLVTTVCARNGGVAAHPHASDAHKRTKSRATISIGPTSTWAGALTAIGC